MNEFDYKQNIYSLLPCKLDRKSPLILSICDLHDTKWRHKHMRSYKKSPMPKEFNSIMPSSSTQLRAKPNIPDHVARDDQLFSDI